MRLLEPRHPDNLDAERPIIVENLITIVEVGHQEAVDAIVGMLADLAENGLDSRYAKVLNGTPVWELKTRSRGGVKGGARVYWFPLEVEAEDEEGAEVVAVVVNAEVKADSTPDPHKLAEALEVYLAFRRSPQIMIRRRS